MDSYLNFLRIYEPKLFLTFVNNHVFYHTQNTLGNASRMRLRLRHIFSLFVTARVKVKMSKSASEPSGPSGRRLTPVSVA